jgi:putative N6-adenine-specific DNA methylase
VIAGSDIDGEAVKAAQQTLAALPGGEQVRVKRLRFEKIEELPNRIVLCNPPYGVRMQKKEGMDAFIRSFGDFLKQRAKGTRAIVYFGRPELLKCVGLQPAWKKALANGGLDGRLARFDVY